MMKVYEVLRTSHALVNSASLVKLSLHLQLLGCLHFDYYDYYHGLSHQEVSHYRRRQRYCRRRCLFKN